jgi:glycosyltransferase involved in cell wall biosynthesis
MKVAINCRLWLPGRLEGVGFFLQEVVTRWLNRYPEVEFHLFFDRSTTLDFSDMPNVEKHVLFPPARHPILYRIWFNLRLPLAFRKLRPDLFFSPEPLSPLPAFDKQIITVHDLAYLHYPETFDKRNLGYYEKYMPSFIKEADHIITVSNFTMADMQKQFPETARKTTVAQNGCRNIFQPLSPKEKREFRQKRTEGKPYFFYYGSLNARKNIDGLLLGFERFKKSEKSSHLLIIGGCRGWKTEEIERNYQDHPFKEDIQFTGYLEEDLLKWWLGAATALTYLSHFEGFGLPVLEAMQSGVSVITSQDSSMEEIAASAGYYADANSISSISECMKEVTSNPLEKERRIERGLKIAETFSWDRTAEKIWSAIEYLHAT